MTGEQIRRTLEQTATNLNPVDKLKTVGGLIQSSGIEYHLDLNKPVGNRIDAIKIQNKDLNPTKLYKVVTHTGMLNGIHNYDEFGKSTNIVKTDSVLTEFVLKNLKEMEELSFPKRMGEVVIKDKQH